MCLIRWLCCSIYATDVSRCSDSENVKWKWSDSHANGDWFIYKQHDETSLRNTRSGWVTTHAVFSRWKIWKKHLRIPWKSRICFFSGSPGRWRGHSKYFQNFLFRMSEKKIVTVSNGYSLKLSQYMMLKLSLTTEKCQTSWMIHALSTGLENIGWRLSLLTINDY